MIEMNKQDPMEGHEESHGSRQEECLTLVMLHKLRCHTHF